MIQPVEDYPKENPPVFKTFEWDKIVDYLNEIWHIRQRELERKDLGDLERQYMEWDVKKTKEFMKRIGY